MSAASKKTAILTHKGRKSGKEFQTPVWYVEHDGSTWIGTRDGKRNWVRNVGAATSVSLDTGNGPREFSVETVDDAASVEAFRKAIRRKYPIASRLLAITVKEDRARVFRLTP